MPQHLLVQALVWHRSAVTEVQGEEALPLFQPQPTGPFSEAGLLLKQPLSSDNQGALL